MRQHSAGACRKIVACVVPAQRQSKLCCTTGASAKVSPKTTPQIAERGSDDGVDAAIRANGKVGGCISGAKRVQ
eukprot:CAMPEP_0172408332 /NCGR_PEP_ID=MMETSP1061-20121228/75799_1 /TAXON_ID=37318 /ORGANISM="Pseudo-nitzschia pungens, Strain cf. pungens" /LENGTH=73 /DNA_ID=CAMNT_0013144457 /DNA_START=1820 /DNA_END=2041 /DNA_ORIENTATION=+